MDSNDPATAEWISGLSPELRGDAGPNNEAEWLIQAERNRPGLLAWRLRYLRSGTQYHLLKFLELRRNCGFRRGMRIPPWLTKPHRC